MKILKRIFQFLFMDYKFTSRVSAYSYSYRRDYLEMCQRDDVMPDREYFPIYVYWDNLFKCVSFLCILLTVLLVCAGVFTAGESSAWECFTSFVYCATIGALFLLMFIPVDYIRAKQEHSHDKVVLIRFRSKKMLDEFESKYAKLEAYVKPYRMLKEQERKEAEQKAQAEREAKRRQEEQERSSYRRKFQVLLEYVETAYKVSTPDPDEEKGKFAIRLPNKDDLGTSSYIFSLDEHGLSCLIVLIARIDAEMRRRAELRSMVDVIAPGSGAQGDS